MWGLISTTFLGLYCLMSYYIGRRGWTALGRPTSLIYKYLYWAFVVLLIFSYPLTEFIEDFIPPSGQVWLTIWGGYSMIAVVYFFMILLAIDFILLFDRRVVCCVPSNIKKHKRTPLIAGASVISIVFSIVIYGGWNAKNPITIDYQVNVNKSAGELKQLRIAMVSDIHYGEIIDAQRVKVLVNKINSLKPDIILIAGDILDGRIGHDKIRKLTDELSNLKTKYGVIGVLGNHDRELRDNVVLSYFEEAGVKILRDEYVKIANSFYVIGRDDAGHGNSQGRKDLAVLLEKVDASLPVIVLDHQPTDLKNAKENLVDLQLSGHTHRGQVFPSNFITEQIYEVDWGLLKEEDYHVIVSSGFGTWGPPLRIGNNSEIVSVMMNFQSF